MKTQFLTLALGLGLVGAFAIQYNTLRGLRLEVAEIRQQMASLEGEAPNGGEDPSTAREPIAAPSPGTSGLQRRVSALEEAVAQLSQASAYHRERGQPPLATNQIDDLHRALTAAGSSDRERLQALRALRRSKALSEDTLQYALNWMQSATNSNLREDVLGQLNGLTNAMLREPFLRLAVNDADPDVRAQAVENLQHLVGDPQVEAQLWQTLQNDPDGDVRRKAEEALREGPMSEARLASLRQHALNPQSSLDEQITALRAMRKADAPVPDVLASMAARAQGTQDPAERARLFEAFDGFNDPALALPLVQGLQDPNPAVREKAADALSGFNADATVQQWLRRVAETDPDPRVRREALQALPNRRR